MARFVDPAFDPGAERVNAEAAPVLKWLLETFDLDLTAGYNPTGPHKSPGHLETGLALDLVPRDGNWDNVAHAVKWATNRGMTVYYDGTNGSEALSGHGPPEVAGENAHAHIELDLSKVGKLGSQATPIGGVLDAAQDVVPDVAGALAAVPGQIVSALFNALGEDGARILLYIVLVVGGTGAILFGASRAVGLGARTEDAAILGGEIAGARTGAKGATA